MINKLLSSGYKTAYVILSIAIILLITSCKNNMDTAFSKMDENIQKIVSSIKSPVIPDRVINLCDFAGYKADETGSHDFYADIRNAIDSLSAMGGGTLLFTHSQGQEAWVKQTEIFRVKGPVILKSNIELKFYPNTKLFFEFAPTSYLPDGKPVLRRYEGTSLYSFCPLLYAFNVENIAITYAGGNGAMPVIDGDGERWQKWSSEGDLHVKNRGLMPAYESIRTELNEKDVPIAERICADTAYHFLRPAMIEFVHCQNIKIDGVKLINSPFWVIHPVFSNNMVIRNIMYDCQVVNNDGVDIESSSDVLVENVVFDNHDDNVVIKSGRDREGRDGALIAGSEYEKINSRFVKNGRITSPTSNVVVRSCAFKGHYAFCVGSEISGGAHNVYATDCSSPMEVMMGIFFKSNRKRGGEVKDIHIQNLNFQQIKYDAICMIPNYDNDTVSPYPTKFSNISINNIKVKSAGSGIRIFGWEDALIKNVSVKNVTVEKVVSDDADKILLINQVENVQLKNVKINNKLFKGNFNKSEKNAYPPRQN